MNVREQNLRYHLSEWTMRKAPISVYRELEHALLAQPHVDQIVSVNAWMEQCLVAGARQLARRAGQLEVKS
jgi:hypothetical protein